MNNEIEKILSYLKNQRDEYVKIYNEDFWSTNTSDSYSDFGDNEFFWWKKEAYEDMINFIEKI